VFNTVFEFNCIQIKNILFFIVVSLVFPFSKQKRGIYEANDIEFYNIQCAAEYKNILFMYNICKRPVYAVLHVRLAACSFMVFLHIFNSTNDYLYNLGLDHSILRYLRLQPPSQQE
jgi:hypothetical protein